MSGVIEVYRDCTIHRTACTICNSGAPVMVYKYHTFAKHKGCCGSTMHSDSNDELKHKIDDFLASHGH